MNNYLASLVARTLNTVPLVRPRLRSRFDRTASVGLITGPQLDRPTHTVWRTETPGETTTSQVSRPGSTHRTKNAVSDVAGPDPASRPRGEDTQAAECPVEISDTAPQAVSTIQAASDPSSLQDIERAQQETHIEVPIISRRLNFRESLISESLSVHRKRLTAGTESSQDELAPKEAGPHVFANVPNGATPVIQTLPGKHADRAGLTRQSNARAKTVLERELRTVVKDEQFLTEDSSLRHDADLDPSATIECVSPSNEIRRPEFTNAPVKVHSRIAPIAGFATEQLRRGQTRVEPPPAIHVTIGRVEVRAVHQSQPQTKPRGAQPLMGLDDYLRRRNQGSPQ